VLVLVIWSGMSMIWSALVYWNEVYGWIACGMFSAAVLICPYKVERRTR